MSKVAESGVPVQKMDADKDQEIVMKYGVRNIPTVLKLDAEGNMIDKFIGVKTAQQVIDFYNG